MYNLKKEGTTAVFLEPTLYPEKIQPLLYCANLCDFAVLIVEEVGREFAEAVVALDLLGRKDGIIAMGPGADEAVVRALVKGTALGGYAFIPLDAAEIRERALAFEPKREAGASVIPIDHSFAVKSVGAVVLGVVARGSVRKHQELEVFPTGKKITARSLQVHDEDVDEAESGARVGIAVKGAEVDELERGFVLAEPGSLGAGETLRAKASVSKFAKDDIREGMQVFVSAGMQFVPAQVEEGGVAPGGSGAVVIKCGKPIAFRRGERMLLVRPDSKGPRVFAALEAVG
jgi:selenocysteine-specific translation elongation factor